MLEEKGCREGGRAGRMKVPLGHSMSEHALLFGYHQVNCLRKGKKIVYSNTTYLQTIYFDGVRNALKVIRIPFCGLMEGSRRDRQ